jgi:S-adenosylmethionine hydrolase
MLNPSGIITLITDFGTDDYFIGAVKGVMLSINPHAKIVDITNSIKPGDLRAGSFILHNSYSHFPKGTVHYCVVDPGVGTERKPLMVYNSDYYFIAPDNGILGPSIKNTHFTAMDITETVRYQNDMSATFHGRDIFAPAAARISKGEDIRNRCRRMDDILITELPDPEFIKDGLQGVVLHIDRFGNVITNLRNSDLTKHPNSSIIIKDMKITTMCSSYYYGPEGEPFFYFGSAGYIEIAYRFDRADKNLDLAVGDKIVLSSNE